MLSCQKLKSTCDKRSEYGGKGGYVHKSTFLFSLSQINSYITYLCFLICEKVGKRTAVGFFTLCSTNGHGDYYAKQNKLVKERQNHMLSLICGT